MSAKKPYIAIFMIAAAFLLMMQNPDSIYAKGGRVRGKENPVKPDPKIVRTAVIGGMVMTKLWDEISKKFEAKTGYKVVVVARGPRPILDKAFREGKADLLTMHSGDITTDLVADG